MSVRFLLVFLCLEAIQCHIIFQWTATSWPQTISNAPSNAPIFKVAYLQDRLTVSCQTNKQNANATLNYQTSRWKPLQSAVTRSKGRIMKLGQVFVIPKAQSSDAGIYTCTAEDPCGTKLTLKKGNLIVLNVIKTLLPEIIPEGHVSIKKYGNFIITCKTKGFGKSSNSLLTWYRKFKDGRKEKIDTSITMTRSEKQVRPDRTVIDVEKLVFINFTSADVGEYTCERQVASAEPTSSSIKVELKNSCVVDCSTYGTDPYCGTNGKTYKNRCELYNAICRSGNKFGEDKKGACEHKDDNENEDTGNAKRGACKDDEMRSRVGFCRMWREDGLCTRLKNTMKEYCPRTCGLCGWNK